MKLGIRDSLFNNIHNARIAYDISIGVYLCKNLCIFAQIGQFSVTRHCVKGNVYLCVAGMGVFKSLRKLIGA